MSRWQVRVLHGPLFMTPYEIFEHTADVGIKISGSVPEEIFTSAAKGMFDIIADTRRIKPKEPIEIEQEAQGYAELLRQWLQELLYQYSVTGILFKEFSVRSLSPRAIKAVAWGDKAPDKIKTEIKAVTYCELEFQQTKDGFEARVIFDV